MSMNIGVSAGVATREIRAKCESQGTAVAQKVAQPGTHLYIIRSEIGVVKIGRSNNPRKRMRDLKWASAHKLTLVKIIRDRGQEEREIHAAVKQWRRRGEWFHDTMAFRDALEAAIGVEIRFRQEHQEEDEVVNTRQAVRHREIIAAAIAKIERYGERKRIRRAEIVEEKAAKERRRIELRAIAADVAMYSDEKDPTDDHEP